MDKFLSLELLKIFHQRNFLLYSSLGTGLGEERSVYIASSVLKSHPLDPVVPTFGESWYMCRYQVPGKSVGKEMLTTYRSASL